METSDPYAPDVAETANDADHDSCHDESDPDDP
jgi:hypothetical protein